MLMDFTLTTMESAKEFQSSQSLVMLASSSKAQRDALSAHLVAEHAQVPPFVLPVLKADSASLTDPAELSVVMESLPELNNAMIETVLVTMDVQLHAQLNHCGLALVSHQSVLITVHQFAEMEESKREKTVTMEISLTEMDAATDVKENQPQLLVATHQATPLQPTED